MNTTQQSYTKAEYDALKTEFESFTYIVSHDFNAPLRHIREFSRLLVKSIGDKIEPNEARYADMVRKSVVRSESMMEGILLLSRINTQSEPMLHFDLNAVYKMALHDLTEAKIGLEVNITCGDLPELYGDKRQISLLFYHLLDNCIKFRKQDSVIDIDIRYEKQGDSWRFIIEDNGIGIDESRHDQVYTMFYKLHEEKDMQGSGVGLTLCKKIVERHGGEIECKNRENGGTAVVFILPAIPKN